MNSNLTPSITDYSDPLVTYYAIKVTPTYQLFLRLNFPSNTFISSLILFECLDDGTMVRWHVSKRSALKPLPDTQVFVAV